MIINGVLRFALIVGGATVVCLLFWHLFPFFGPVLGLTFGGVVIYGGFSDWLLHGEE
jgi:hypothetical protein